MTAGAGIIHSEMPSRALREHGGRVHGFQVWVNLPASLKMTTPRYQEISGTGIPQAQTADGRARVRVVAGEALGAHAVIDTHTPIVYQDWSLAPGGDVTIPIGRRPQGVRLRLRGQRADRRRAATGHLAADGQMALLGAGDSVRLRGAPRRRPLAAAGRRAAGANRSRATAPS